MENLKLKTTNFIMLNNYKVYTHFLQHFRPIITHIKGEKKAQQMLTCCAILCDRF